MSNDKSTKRKYPPIKANEITSHEQSQFKGVFDRMHRTLASQESKVASQPENTASPQINETASKTEDLASGLAKNNSTTASKLVTFENTASRDIENLASRKLKTDRPGRVRFNHRIRIEVYERIRQFCHENNLAMQDFVEYAAIHLIESVASRGREVSASKLALDDRGWMRIVKSKPFLIRLYGKYNAGRAFKQIDDEAACAFNDSDPRIIEAAMVKTKLTAKDTLIKSFKYFVPEIEYHLSIPLPEEAIAAMYASAMRAWEREGK